MTRSWRRWLRTAGHAACVLLLGACGSARSGMTLSGRPQGPEPARVHSNITRADYAGSEECRLCHAEIYAAWQRSPMHRMTRRAAQAEIRAPFDGAVFRVKQDSVRMEQVGGARFMRLSRPEGEQLYRITKVIGGRYREDFAGIEVTGARDPVTDHGRGAELVMPASYVFSTGSFRSKGYSVMVTERPGLAAGPIWAGTCIGCHNTLPYLTYLYDDLYGPGAKGYQGRISDHLLPRSRVWVATPLDEARLQRVIADEVQFLGVAPPPAGAPLAETLERAATVTRRKLDASHLVEVGIGCEACHGGAREHANDPRSLPALGVRSPLLRFGPPAGPEPTAAQQLNHVCARCHTVLFSGYPWSWEGGERKGRNPGGSTTNSGEARDLLLGGCNSELRCTACHDPHAEDQPARLHALEGPAGNALCAGCHTDLRSQAAVAAHTHHKADGAGSACINCHMPRKNMGLDYALTRYHRIGAPTDEVRVLRDRPLECALCHADKSVEQLVSSMERFYGKRYDRDALRELYGPDLAVNALTSTLEGGKPHEQAVALAVLGERRDVRVLPELARQLAHAYPLVRHFAKRAIEKITGSALPIDVEAPAAEVAAQAAKWVASQNAGQAQK